MIWDILERILFNIILFIVTLMVFALLWMLVTGVTLKILIG